jgi:hypothetical protein
MTCLSVVGGHAILTCFSEPAEVAAALERDGYPIVEGGGERYTGYAVLGVGFASGDVLALRRFPLTSTGSAYTSVWHRSASGRWTLFTDVAGRGCAHHFGPALDEVVVAPIRIEWTGPRSVSIAVDGGRRLIWSLLMRSTAITRVLNRAAPHLSPLLARYPRLLVPLAAAARVLLRTGPLRLIGMTPSGHVFMGRPWGVWIVRASRACIAGHDTGPNRPFEGNVSVGGFHIPTRGVFAASHAVIAASRHS